ncbi:Detected protein of unknown function [Hibiscus syriacus]|uniref:Uncharacterized protein n=1 Tax=Hibiscus syriacus TaxID=106335 RepID=A0A6A3B5Z9_HIBSY|nr:Detected protein of unknown function [Hibiscus syriacus]
MEANKGSIQQLLAAEQDAQHIVNAARNGSTIIILCISHTCLEKTKTGQGRGRERECAQVEDEFQKKVAEVCVVTVFRPGEPRLYSFDEAVVGPIPEEFLAELLESSVGGVVAAAAAGTSLWLQQRRRRGPRVMIPYGFLLGIIWTVG